MDRKMFVRTVQALVLAAPLAFAGAALAQAPKGKLNVAVGTAPPDLTLQSYYFAFEKGYYKDEGVDVHLQALNGDATVMRALGSGDADIAAGVGLGIPLKAIEAGSKLKIILAVSPKMDYLLVAQKGINGPKDFEGKNLGVSGPGAVSYQVPLLMIKAAGGDPAKVHFVSVGGTSARTLALIAKKIDGAVLNSSFAYRTTKYDYLHNIGEAAKDLPNFIYTVEVASESTIQKRRDALQAFANATLRGARWAMQNPNDAIAISQKYLPNVPKEEIAAGLQHFAETNYFNLDGALRKEAWDFTVDELVKSGEIKHKLSYADHVLPEFGRAAAKKLAATPK